MDWAQHRPSWLDGLVQDCCISSLLAMEILQSYTEPSVCEWDTYTYTVYLRMWHGCVILSIFFVLYNYLPVPNFDDSSTVVEVKLWMSNHLIFWWECNQSSMLSTPHYIYIQTFYIHSYQCRVDKWHETILQKLNYHGYDVMKWTYFLHYWAFVSGILLAELQHIILIIQIFDGSLVIRISFWRNRALIQYKDVVLPV